LIVRRRLRRTSTIPLLTTGIEATEAAEAGATGGAGASVGCAPLRIDEAWPGVMVVTVVDGAPPAPARAS